MAEKIVSPGVFTRENDLSYIAQGVGAIGAAIVGPFKKGPAFLPTVINTQSEFEEIFGTPDGTYYTGYTVQNYLQEASSVTIVRVGHTGGYSHTVPLAISVSGSAVGNRLISTLFGTTAVSESIGFAGAYTLDTQPSASAFSIAVGGTITSASVNPTDVNDIRDIFGSSAKGTKDVYSYNYFENESANVIDYLTNSGSTVEVTELPTQEFLNDILYASTPWIKSQDDGNGNRSDLFRFHTLGHGGVYNKEFKVSISNIQKASAQSVAKGIFYPTFTVTLRGYTDLDKRQSVIETYPNVNLNPSSPNYIAKLIGDIETTIDANGKITETGDYPNKSKFIRVEVSAEGSFPVTAAPFAHGAYTTPIYVGSTGIVVPGVIYSTGSYNNTTTSKYKHAGIDLETADIKIDNNFYLNPTPANATVGENTDFSFDGNITAIVNGVVGTFNFRLTVDDSTTRIAQTQFTVGFQGGFDGVTPTRTINLGSNITETNSQGFDLSTSTSSGSVSYVKAINSVSNPDDFDINLISAPGVIRRLHSYVFDYIVTMVENREDAFYIGDVTAVSDTIQNAIDQGDSVDSNYVGTYYPWVKTIDRNTNRLTAVPPSVLMPGIYAANDTNAAEWWAPAGLNRGGITGAVSVLNRLTHAERDELYEGKINPIATFPGEGIVAFGQKTLQEAASALDRINVRRLLIKVKKYIASTSRYLVFEQNTAQTRATFINTVNPYLEGIQQRQGLYSFKVVMDESNNTPDVIDRNILKGAIYLQPTRTAEFIVLDFNILPTGAAFSS